MTTELADAKATVASAIAHGLSNDDDFPLSSTTEEFTRTFGDFDEHMAAGTELQGAWLLTQVYHPPSYGPVAEATTLFAVEGFNEFINAVENVADSRLFYDLVGVPLLAADFARCCDWLRAAQSKRLMALALAAALRRLLHTHHAPADGWSAPITVLAETLRSRRPDEQSSIWWQIAARARFLSPIDDWSDLAHEVWLRAAAEIARAHTNSGVDLAIPAGVLELCPFLHALLAEIAEHTQARSAAADRILADFATRVDLDEDSMPQLRDRAEVRLYLTACGWAIAQDLRRAQASFWWEHAVSARLPHFPSWHRDFSDDKRCSLILLAACHAVQVLTPIDRPKAISLLEKIREHTDRWLPRWLWEYTSTQGPAHGLALALLVAELTLGPAMCDADRVVRIVREIRDAREIERVVTELERSYVLAPSILAELGQLRDERGAFERRLRSSAD